MAEPDARLIALRRDALARLLMDKSELLRAVARTRLTEQTRRVYDSTDVLSSTLRQVDELAQRGHFASMSDDDVLRFAITMVRNRAISRTRSMERARARLSEDGEYSQMLLKRLEACRDDDEATVLCYHLALSIEHPVQRQVFMLRWQGMTPPMIEAALGISRGMVNKLWYTLRQDLLKQLREGRVGAEAACQTDRPGA